MVLKISVAVNDSLTYQNEQQRHAEGRGKNAGSSERTWGEQSGHLASVEKHVRTQLQWEHS